MKLSRQFLPLGVALLLLAPSTTFSVSDDDTPAPQRHRHPSSASPTPSSAAAKLKKSLADVLGQSSSAKSSSKKGTASSRGKHATPSPTPEDEETPAPKAKKSPTPEDGETPRPSLKKGTTPSHKKHATPSPTPDAEGTPVPKAKPTPEDTTPPSAIPTPTPHSAAENATLDPEQLVEYAKQPERVQGIIVSSLALTKQNLSYIYGSADPTQGGLDCSGFIYHVLRENGITDVPRDASGQYVWIRKADNFEAVLSQKKDTFELKQLQPGDLLFWTGTYSSEKDPPVTHTMIYLGTEKGTGRRVMVGSSDGRTYDGKSRWGVSVFDFKISTNPPGPESKTAPMFVGYGAVPGLRD